MARRAQVRSSLSSSFATCTQGTERRGGDGVLRVITDKSFYRPKTPRPRDNSPAVLWILLCEVRETSRMSRYGSKRQRAMECGPTDQRKPAGKRTGNRVRTSIWSVAFDSPMAVICLPWTSLSLQESRPLTTAGGDTWMLLARC